MGWFGVLHLWDTYPVEENETEGCTSHLHYQSSTSNCLSRSSRISCKVGTFSQLQLFSGIVYQFFMAFSKPIWVLPISKPPHQPGDSPFPSDVPAAHRVGNFQGFARPWSKPPFSKVIRSWNWGASTGITIEWDVRNLQFHWFKHHK